MICPYYQNSVFMPKWISNKGVMLYLAVLAFVSLAFSRNILNPGWMIIGVVEVLSFFLLSNYLSKKWGVDRVPNPKKFEQKVFVLGLLLRLVTIGIVYWGFMIYYGDAFGFENADCQFYQDMGGYLGDAAHEGRFRSFVNGLLEEVDISDIGHIIYLSFIYYFTGRDAIMVPRIINCFISAYTIVLIYRLGSRNFGEQIGRLAGLLVMAWPNFWFYCGTQLKEPMMIFILTLYAERCDQMLRNRNFTAWKVAPILLLAGAMFTLRTPLALVMVLAMIFTIVMSSSKVVGWGKRILVGILALVLLGVTMGNRIEEQTRELFNQVQSNQQSENMQWRTERENGNQLAKYAGKAVFAPLIFTIPFPTMVETPEQYDLKVVNGGNFCKNIISGFVIFAMFSLLLSGNWRKHLMPLALLLGYLVVLSVSTFAQSERFHQPAVPFEMLFAAYSIGIIMQGERAFGRHLPRASTRTYKLWFTIWCAGIVIACIGWQWFKLKGRGMV